MGAPALRPEYDNISPGEQGAAEIGEAAAQLYGSDREVQDRHNDAEFASGLEDDCLQAVPDSP